MLFYFDLGDKSVIFHGIYYLQIKLHTIATVWRMMYYKKTGWVLRISPRFRGRRCGSQPWPSWCRMIGSGGWEGTTQDFKKVNYSKIQSVGKKKKINLMRWPHTPPSCTWGSCHRRWWSQPCRRACRTACAREGCRHRRRWGGRTSQWWCQQSCLWWSGEVKFACYGKKRSKLPVMVGPPSPSLMYPTLWLKNLEAIAALCLKSISKGSAPITRGSFLTSWAVKEGNLWNEKRPKINVKRRKLNNAWRY